MISTVNLRFLKHAPIEDKQVKSSKKEKQYSIVKEQGRVESPAILLPKSTSCTRDFLKSSFYTTFQTVINNSC